MAESRSSSGLDMRSQKSIARLRQALLELVEAKPYEQITVREIAKAAGVTFPTFYRHYEDKEKLFSEIAVKEIYEFMAVMLRHLDASNPRLSAKAICDYVIANRILWKTLLTSGATAAMREEFIRLSRDVVAKRGQINPEYPPAMMAPFVASAIFEILSWWLSQGTDYPREKVEYFLDILVLRPTMTKQDLDIPGVDPL